MTSELVQTLLRKRGLVVAEDIDRFLKPNYARDTHDPFLLHDMEKAVARILAGIEKGERIAVYADFDCDGIPGASVLHDFFAKVGYSNVTVYIPHRDREGYGLHKGAIDSLLLQGVALLITVDVGGSAHESVQYAQEKGIDVIVTDHHELAHGVPPAYAVINPKLDAYPFPDLCGAAVAWKLVCALLEGGRKRGLAPFAATPVGWEKWLLDLVAIATIADLVPLVGENRTLAHFGLTVLRKSPRAGIRALIREARMRQASITEEDIAFAFAPRINAASRMDEPEAAFRLLTTESLEEAESLAHHLEELNKSRKGVVGSMVREARKRVEARFTERDRVVVLGDTSWKPALAGLVANSIMEDRGGVVCVWGRDVNGKLKGSCRSDGSLSVVELFGHPGVVLEEYGGHNASGGFSVSHEDVHTLPEKLAHAAHELGSRVVEVPVHDAELSLSAIGSALVRDLSSLAPFGIGNPKPLFRFLGVRIMSARQFGKEMNHTEVMLSCVDSGIVCRAFQYFRTPLDFSLPPTPGIAADVLATVERDAYRGGTVLRIADLVHPRG